MSATLFRLPLWICSRKSRHPGPPQREVFDPPGTGTERERERERVRASEGERDRQSEVFDPPCKADVDVCAFLPRCEL